jgi:hypothetical protein
MAMRGLSRTKNITFATSAGFGVSARDVASEGNRFVTAIASVDPFRSTSITHGDEVGETLSSNVNKSYHNSFNGIFFTEGQC